MLNYEDGSYGSVTGIALIGKVIAGRCQMRYTRAAVGKGIIPEGKTPKTMDVPPDYVMDAKIAGVTNPVDGECQVTIQIKSDDVEVGFYLTSIILYAEDPDEGEVPYTYLCLEKEPEWIRPSSSAVGKFATFDLIAAVGDVDTVSAIIDPEAIATIGWVERSLETKVNQEDFEEHITDATMHFTSTERDKLKGIDENANNYTHPASHPSGMIEQDGTHRFVSDDQINNWDDALEEAQKYTDAAYQQLTGYTDQKIADLVNGAPDTLDTLGEIAKAMSENEDVVTALHEAMGKKANQAEVESWLGTKMDKTGDSGSTTANYTSDDTEKPSVWKDFALFTGLEKVKEFFAKVSTMASNLRWLYDKYNELNSKLGGYSIKVISESEYQSLVSQGTTDPTTIYLCPKE